VDPGFGEGAAVRAIKFLFWAAVLFTLVMALIPHPFAVPGDPSDKVQHMLAFAVLACLGSLAYPRRGLRIAFGLIAFGAAIELLQMIPALHRDPELADWAVDIAAAMAVLVALRLLFRARTA